MASIQPNWGFTCRHHDEAFAIFVRDDVEMHLWKSGDESWKIEGASLIENPVCSGTESFIAGTASCRIEVQGIDELFEEYKNENVLHSVSSKVEEQPWGDRVSCRRSSSKPAYFLRSDLKKLSVWQKLKC